MSSYPTPRKEKHLPSILLLVFSGITLLTLWGLSASLVFLGLVQWGMDAGATGAAAGPGGLVQIALVNVLMGFLLFPGMAFSLDRLRGGSLWQPRARFLPLRRVLWLFPVIALLGFGISQFSLGTWLILPFLHILGIGIPLAWFIGLGAQKIGNLSRLRVWGIFTTGLFLGPILILLLELLLEHLDRRP